MTNSITKSTRFAELIRFTMEEAQAANEQWGFNCGPCALCGVLGKTPAEIRPFLGDFEAKRYTNPTMMAAILKKMNVPFKSVFVEKSDCLRDSLTPTIYPRFGLVRIQWDGRWCDAGVPVAARYRKTHWIGFGFNVGSDSRVMVFDVNALAVGGWIPFTQWSKNLAPWLIEQCVQGGSGKWWPTHCWELDVPIL